MDNFELKTVQQKAPRNASFEILRILAMLLIIFSHFWGHGGWENMTGANFVLGKIVHGLFMPSVNIFVLISAYFMSSQKQGKTLVPWKKIAKLWLGVSFYSLLLYTIFYSAGVYEFNAKELVASFFPIMFGKYWFFSAYVFMMVASPFLNIVCNHLNKKQHLLLCLGIVLVASLQDAKVFGAIPFQNGYNAIWFCMLYVIGAFLRKYDINMPNVVAIVGAFVYVVFVAICYFVGAHYSSAHVILMTIYLFLLAKKINITHAGVSKVICKISSITFGVYLIHDSNEMRGFMYEHIFHSSNFIESKYAFLIFVGFVLATFVVCGVADALRQLLFCGVGRVSSAVFARIKVARASKMQNAIEQHNE